MFKLFYLFFFIASIFLGCSSNDSLPNKTLQSSHKQPSFPSSQTTNTAVIHKGESLEFSLAYLSQENIKSIVWQDQNGKLLSKASSFNRLFLNEGEYQMHLIVTDMENHQKVDTIKVKVLPLPLPITNNQPPVVKIAPTHKIDIIDGESIHLSNNGSYDPDGYITNYEWRDMDGILLSNTNTLDRVLYYNPQYDFNHNGTTTYVKTLVVTDNKGAISTQSITIVVHKKKKINTDTTPTNTTPTNTTPTNHPPVSNPQSITLSQDSTVQILLSASDADNDPLTYTILTYPSHGTLTGTPPNLIYTPSNQYSGSDYFTFIVNDTKTNSTPARVDIGVQEVLTTGYIIDAPIKGLTYICGDRTGITDALGKFICSKTPITFKVGALTIATLDAFTDDKKVYPQDLLHKERSAVEDDDVVELARFLQMLDDDGDISQYTNITSQMAAKFTTSQSLTDLTALERIELLSNLGISFKHRGDVIAHLRDTLSLTPSRLYQALSSGDGSGVEASQLYQALEKEANDKLHLCQSTLNYLYPEGLQEVLFPGSRADYFSSGSPNNIPFHVAKNAGDTRVYSYIGEKPSLARYAVLGTNIFKFDANEGYTDITNNLNQELKTSTIQLLKWLLKQEKESNLLEKTLTIVVNSSYMKTSLQEWLSDNSLVAPNWTITTDTSLIENGTFDLYIAASERSLNYKNALEKQKPVIVFENWISPPTTMLEYFEIQWRWYGGSTVGDWDSIDELCKSTMDEYRIYETIKNLENDTLQFNYNDTACPNNFGKVTCSTTLLENSNGKTLGEEFMYGANAIRSILSIKDKKGENIFHLAHHYDALKLVTLLAESYRNSISYPMDKVETDDTTFYKALFADYAIHYAKENNSYQPNLGDFTSDVPRLRSLATSTKTITMTPTAYSEWSATGLYAIPGKTITIKRIDSSDNKVQVRFNMMRIDTSRIWNPNSYTRPRFIASNPIILETGKEYKISTPIGGPIYLYWEGIESNAVPFSVKFQNVVPYPSLLSLDRTAIDTFVSEIDTSPFDWVDIKTPYVEIHSLRSKFQEAYTTAGDFPYNGDLTLYLENINQYLVKNNLNLAGFKGDELALSTPMQAWCTQYGLDCTSDIHKKPKIQHINSDIHASCGSGCSGNPFDASWAITPTGWGDSHEYGHNLQRNRLKIYEGRSTEVSNNIFPLHTNWRYLVDHNIALHPKLKAPENQETYLLLQTEIQKNTPASIDHPLWSSDGTYDNAFKRLCFYNQLVFSHHSWEIYTKLYIVDRLFENALLNDTNWESNKAKLGFSNYTRSEAKEINGNDFMAIALSMFTQIDHRDYFQIWGVEITQKAKDQIEQNGYNNTLPLEYYLVYQNRQTKDFPTKTMPLDGLPIETITLSGVCTSTILSECSNINGTLTIATPPANTSYLLARWSQNGPTTKISTGTEGYALLYVEAMDDEGNSKTITIRAAKTTSSQGIDANKVAMNDITNTNATTTTFLFWIDPSDNTLEAGRHYRIVEDIYLALKEGETTTKWIKLNFEEIFLVTNLTFTSPTQPLVQSYPEEESSSTYFVTLSNTQGPTNGVWENNLGYTTLTLKAKDSNANSVDIKLRAQRDAYSSDGTSSTKVIMNSGITYGKNNALVITYHPEDNPSLISGEHYVSTELLIIDAKLWQNNKLRERLYISFDLTAP